MDGTWEEWRAILRLWKSQMPLCEETGKVNGNTPSRKEQR